VNAPAIRAWVAADDQLDAVAALLDGFRATMGRERPTAGEIRLGVERIRAAGDGEYLLASSGGAPDGVCQLRFRASVWTGADDAWIEDVFVRESARGQGLGRALVELAIERSRARGCLRVELDVDEANPPAMALYGALGFSADLKADGHSRLLGLRL
jgi:GNAT superfamily N-acetyltransferase